MSARSRRSAPCAAFLALWSLTAAAGQGAEGELRSLAYLPEDAVWVVATQVDSFATPYDSLLKLLHEFAPADAADEMLAPFEAWETAVGVSLRDDLLGVLGGEAAFAVAFDDLDRIGTLAMAAAQGGALDLEGILGGVMAVVGVQDPDHFDRSLRRLVESVGGRVETAPGGVRRLHFLHQEKVLTLLHYRYHGGFAVFGFADGPLTDAVLRAETGHNLLAAARYRHVFSHLREEPTSVGYLNLPRVRQLLLSSNLVRAAVSSDPKVEGFFRRFVEEPDWRAGIGWASYPVEGGVVQQSFAPFNLGTFTNAYMGIIAAVAVPNFLNAMDKGRQSRTIADIRDIGMALEAYAVDHGAYPPGVGEPTPVGGGGEANLERWLVPTYIARLPSADAWGNPFVYRSDPKGMTYLLSSYGRDGAASDDDSGAAFDADIHFANGIFLATPEGTGP